MDFSTKVEVFQTFITKAEGWYLLPENDLVGTNGKDSIIIDPSFERIFIFFENKCSETQNIPESHEEYQVVFKLFGL